MISSQLIKLRNKKGWSQEFLAEKLNVSRQTLHKWESGKVNPNIKNLILISTVFDVSVDFLINKE